MANRKWIHVRNEKMHQILCEIFVSILLAKTSNISKSQIIFLYHLNKSSGE